MHENYSGGNLVFLVGAPRSGTTWLQRLLAAHPLVATGQESHLFSEFIGPQLRHWRHHADVRERQRGGVGPGCYHTEEQFRAILRSYMLQLMAPMIEAAPTAGIFLEKTPGHALFMQEISDMLPDARFVHIIRDARDVVASLVRAGESWGSDWASTSTVRAAAMWVRHVRAARRAGALLGAERYFEVRYEDLHTDGVGTLGSVLDYLHLSAGRTHLSYVLEANSTDALRNGNGTPIPLGGAFGGTGGATVREPDGFIGEARVGRGLVNLSITQRTMVRAVAGREMAAAGYFFTGGPIRFLGL
jgi:LPS sulfotransferase NodH